MWVPGNPLAKRAGIDEDPQQPRTYLQKRTGRSLRPIAYRCIPRQLSAAWWRSSRSTPHCNSSTGTRFPDMHGNVPGAATQGHQVIAAPYDGRELGPLITRLRKTMRETSFMGMPIMAGADLDGFPEHDALVQVAAARQQALHSAPDRPRAVRTRDATGQRRRADRTAREVGREAGRHADRVRAGEALDPREAAPCAARSSPPRRARSRFARPGASCSPLAASPTT